MRTRMSLIAAALLVLAGCGDGTGPATGGQVSLSFASNAAVAAAAPSSWAGPMAVDGAGDHLVLTSVKVVLREIELESAEVVDCDVADGEPEPAGCEDFEIGPTLINLTLGGATTTEYSIAVPVGTYDEVEFDIHKVSSSDGTFSTDHPEMDGYSILVAGTYNGTVFEYGTDLNEEQEYDLIPPLVVTEVDGVVGNSNITIRLDVSTWFKDANGVLFDPATAAKGQPNEDLLKNNIKNSIDAFEDSDHDGHHDDES